jgi:hypothetical protein
MPESASRIVAVTAGVNPVSGVDSYMIDFDDGETQNPRRAVVRGPRARPTGPGSTTGRTALTGPVGRAEGLTCRSVRTAASPTASNDRAEHPSAVRTGSESHPARVVPPDAHRSAL